MNVFLVVTKSRKKHSSQSSLDQSKEVESIKECVYAAFDLLGISKNSIDFFLALDCKDAFEKILETDILFDLAVIRIHAQDECESLGIFEVIQNRVKSNDTKIISVFDQLSDGNQFLFDPENTNLKINRTTLENPNKLMSFLNTLLYSPCVYVSYGNDKRNKYMRNFTKVLHELFPKVFPHIKLLQDDKDISIRGSLSQFFGEMKSSDYVITLLNDHYFKSYYCMDELTGLLLNESSEKSLRCKIFPVVFRDAKYIFEESSSDFDSIYDYWDSEFRKMEELTQTANRNDLKIKKLENTKKINKNLNVIQSTLSDINIRHSDDLIKDRMLDLFFSVSEQLQSDGYKNFYKEKLDIEKILSAVSVSPSEYYFNILMINESKKQINDACEIVF